MSHSGDGYKFFISSRFAYSQQDWSSFHQPPIGEK